MNKLCIDKDNPLVSVIIPFYNRENTILYTLYSVYKQSYRPIEMIVIDDGSTDRTAEIIEEWMKEHRRSYFDVHLIRQENNGAQTARNHGLQKCRGTYIQFLDSDDLLLTEKIQKQVTALDTSHADVAYGDSLVGPNWKEAIRKKRGQIADPVESLIGKWWNPSFSYLIRRETALATGKWDVDLKVAQDFDYALRMALSGAHFKYVSVLTGLYRRHSGSTISSQGGYIRARSQAHVLQKVEHSLNNQDALTPKRKNLLAQRYIELSGKSFKENESFFWWGLEQARRLDSTAKHPLKWRRPLIRILGYRLEQKSYNIARNVYGQITGK